MIYVSIKPSVFLEENNWKYDWKYEVPRKSFVGVGLYREEVAALIGVRHLMPFLRVNVYGRFESKFYMNRIQLKLIEDCTCLVTSNALWLYNGGLTDIRRLYKQSNSKKSSPGWPIS